MTFKQFEAIVKEYRPDAVVSKHGGYWNGKSDWRLGIYFVDENGNESRVYKYGGTYQQVLSKLGIETVTKEQIEVAKMELERCKEQHGKPDMFFGNTVDMTGQIKFWEEELAKAETAVKVWEY